MDMTTPWTELVDPEMPLPAYPRPQLARPGWINLNGRWDYAINDSRRFPQKFDGEILVPFSPETELSGVQRSPKPGEYLWYRRSVSLPEKTHTFTPDSSKKPRISSPSQPSNSRHFAAFSQSSAVSSVIFNALRLLVVLLKCII